MDKTIKINLAGNLFQIDEEAYRLLRDYLQEIDIRFRNVQGGSETIEDIESRIAEIFQSQKGLAGVITIENVESMISIIGKPQDFDMSGEERIAQEYSPQRKKMYRNPDDAIIGGVCSGIGAYLDIDSVWVRILFIIFTFFFGIGFFVYVALWVALPYASSEAQRKEMYGARYRTAPSRFTQNTGKAALSDPSYSSNARGGSGIGNAFNEVFRALGKVCYIIVRIFLILLGISFVLTGFFALVSFVMIFFFQYPGFFSIDSHDINIFYLPEFLNYIVNPALAPWILALTFIVIVMPLLAFIYWGVKMIFWFRAKDGVISLIGFIIWVMSLAALSIILFNEGISFAETAKTVSREVVEKSPQKLYIMSDNTVAELKYDKEISFPDDEYNLYFLDNNKDLYIGTNLNINGSENNAMTISVRKRSAGRSELHARQKAESLQYNYRMAGDTLFVDEYFRLPYGAKWACDNVGINLMIPEGTTVIFDETTERMYRHYDHRYDADYDEEYVEGSVRSWVMTKDGMREHPEPSEKMK